MEKISYIITSFITIMTLRMIIKIHKLKNDFECYGVKTTARVEEYKYYKNRIYPFIKFQDGEYEIYSNVVADGMDESKAPIGTEFEIAFLRREKQGKYSYAVRATDERFRPQSIENVLKSFYIFFALSLILTIYLVLKFYFKVL